MNTFELLSQYLASPIVAHRNKALMCLLEKVSSSQVVDQLGLNLRSDNFDIIWGSLRVIYSASLRDPKRIVPLNRKIIELGKRIDHFGIVNLCNDILIALKSIDSTIGLFSLISKKISPMIKSFEDSEMFFDNCDHILEYSLGDRDYKYELAHICTAFRYDCKKASMQVFSYMRSLGYREGIQYWKERPSRWHHDFEGNRYETKLQYYARHGIQMFLMWCIKNLSISTEAWNKLLIYELKWDASFPTLLIHEKPDFIKFINLQMEVDAWLKKKIKKMDAYELFNSKAIWIPLYESTILRSENKSFDRHATTCFIRTPIGRLSKKIELAPIFYACRQCLINELPIKAKENGWLTLGNNSHYDFLEGKLIPSYGIVSDDSDNYVKLFPAPEIVEYFKLVQKKNSLEYYKGKEPIIRCINWRSGYHRKTDGRGEDRFELANYGHLLMIKTQYLKEYLNKKGLKLIAVGNIWKKKIDKWGRDYNYEKKNSRHKWLSLEIVNL